MLETMSSDPILEAVFAINFTSPNKAISSILLGTFSAASFKQRFTQLERLPISDIPLSVRQKDINLRFQPEHRLHGKGETLLIGSNTIGVAVNKPYIGGSAFVSMILEILEVIQSLNEEINVERVAFRYINFLEMAEGDKTQFDQIRFEGSLGNLNLAEHNTMVRIELSADDCSHSITLKNQATALNTIDNVSSTGLLLDIDTSIKSGLKNFWSQKAEIINSLRAAERDTFEMMMREEALERYKTNV